MSLTPINVSDEIKNIINDTIPDYLIKTRKGGGNMELSYISGITVIDILNRAFGIAGWNWTVKDQWIQDSQPYFNKFSKSPDAASNWDFGGAKGRLDYQGPVCHVLGTLSVQIKDDDGKLITIQKDGFGSKSILGKQTDQESIYKAAATDALKKAASLLGIGGQLYRDDNEAFYFNELSYVDPWEDEEVQKKYETELTSINNIIEENNLSQEDFQNICYEVSETYTLTPDNCIAVNDYLVKKYPPKKKLPPKPVNPLVK